ncbi:hypothetical protein LGL08_09565 [Clostridium estertheticum]|uniref:hypothetical protein n=1 Tax=Clostridium estertheticum TaxID=238834 RepID=UPI001CF1AD11|nr:hypothetical protein [Clostridium estertheticum]MCB2307392.1 hypothetical protein [Clostridium estertheticum]MCB2345042.1 hypothetical protein [Clostridium estertheticum]MCB2349798.1 hypothetical protein [Clostridium estertheticum]WAG48078.1 hypothetical protein LL127_21740 [Clostridium estertheticum]
MKRLILILLTSILIFSGCANTKSVSVDNTKGKFNINDVDTLKIITLPSPPKEKTITKKEDIKKVINLIISIKKEPIKQKEDIKGWSIWIETDGKEKHSICFFGEKVEIDNLWYKINNNDIDKIKNLYRELDYKEENYPPAY